MKPTGLPLLEGWTALPDAAAELGMSRQRAHQLLKETLDAEETGRETGRTRYFTTARQVGTVIIVRTAEVDYLKNLRASLPPDDANVA